MPVEITNTVDDCTFFRTDLSRCAIPFDADIVVAGKQMQGDSVAESPEDPWQLVIFLPGDGRNAVLDIAEQHESVRICPVNDLQEPFEPCFAPAPEMNAMNCEIRLDSEMEIGNDKVSLLTRDYQRRTLTDKFQVHSGLTNPFWGW